MGRPPLMITDKENLLAWKKRASAQAQGRVVLDLEADSMHRFREKLCLIQYADAEGVEIIDPLAIEDMRPFALWLEKVQVWMHGADYDMCLLQNTFGLLPALILDTQIAARLLGFKQFGLAALVKHFYGITLSKKNQKADWARRPIPDDMLDYAQGDVVYMLDMADRLVADLRRKGRYEWFIESCEWNMERGRERFISERTEAWRIKGCGKLTNRGLAALRELWRWRSAEAEMRDKPVFMVCSNEELLSMCMRLQEFRIVTPFPRWNGARSARFSKAVEHFQLLDEEEYPKHLHHPRHTQNSNFEKQLERWLSLREQCASALEIDPSLIASRAQIEAIAHEESEGLTQLMNWQRELLLAPPKRRKKWWQI